MNRIITPPEYNKDLNGPLIFLAGPVKGTRDWQRDAFVLLSDVTDAHIASPRRLGEWQELDEEETLEQKEWEYYHLGKAQENGVILFWLAKEIEPILGRTHAQTTRMELGKFSVLYSYAGAEVVVGIESGYSGETYVRFILDKDAPDIPIFDNLPGACLQAAELAG